jgi:hypothetical protein
MSNVNPLAAAWEGSKGVENKFSELPDNTYKMKVLSCGFGKTKDGADKIEWNFEVIEPAEFARRKHWVHRKLDPNNQKTIDRAKGDFLDLGLDAGISTITNTMAAIVGQIVEINLRTTDQGNQFTNFRRIVEQPAGALPDSSEGPF